MINVLWKKLTSFPACAGVQHASGPVPRIGHFHWGRLGQLPLSPSGNAQDKNQRLWNGPPGTPKTCCHLRVGASWHYLVIHVYDVWMLAHNGYWEWSRPQRWLLQTWGFKRSGLSRELRTNYRPNYNPKVVWFLYMYWIFGSLSVFFFFTKLTFSMLATFWNLRLKMFLHQSEVKPSCLKIILSSAAKHVLHKNLC